MKSSIKSSLCQSCSVNTTYKTLYKLYLGETEYAIDENNEKKMKYLDYMMQKLNWSFLIENILLTWVSLLLKMLFSVFMKNMNKIILNIPNKSTT